MHHMHCRAAAAELFGRDLPPGPVPVQQVRNSDFLEAVLKVGRQAVQWCTSVSFYVGSLLSAEHLNLHDSRGPVQCGGGTPGR
jgi:hypothetical protein